MITPLDSDAVDTLSAEAMLSDSVFCAVCCGVDESVTVSVTLKLPDAVGVPLRVPALFTPRPAGNPVALQLYGAVPPSACIAVEG